jgi:hypothetical protein
VRLIKTREVIVHFERCTGRRLEVVSRLRVRRLFRTKIDTLALPEEDERFGYFEISVYLNPEVALVEPFLTTPIGLGPGKIRWGRHVPERLDEQGFWVVSRMYRNVLLSWNCEIPPRPREPWRRLDAILSSLPTLSR